MIANSFKFDFAKGDKSKCSCHFSFGMVLTPDSSIFRGIRVNGDVDGDYACHGCYQVERPGMTAHL
jgi:hypothetical protein